MEIHYIFIANTNTICVLHSGPKADSHLLFGLSTAFTSSTKVSGNIAMDLLIHWALFAYVQLELEERVPWNGVASRACWMLQDIEERYQRRGQDVITPPPPPPKPKPPPTNVPSNRSAERHEALPKDARTSAETSATDHSRCSEVTMIWKEIRTKRGLRRPSETKQGQRAMISLSDAVVCSGNFRAGGYKYMCIYTCICKPLIKLKSTHENGV